MCIVRLVNLSHTGQAAPLFTDLTATNIQYDRATIQWTVPVIAYTPETYVVNYGNDVNTLNNTSEAVSSGSDFEATDLTFSVLITGLTSNIVYYYQLVATNTFASTSSAVMNFTTLEQSKFMLMLLIRSWHVLTLLQLLIPQEICCHTVKNG